MKQIPMFFDGERCEVKLQPSDFQIDQMTSAARNLMELKMQEWILDQLTVEQLATCIKLFKEAIAKRVGTTTDSTTFNESKKVTRVEDLK